MINSEPLIQEFMTLQPQTIDPGETVETAKKVMEKFDIKHLPVIKNGVLCGVLNERDISVALAKKTADPKKILVSQACVEKPYTVYPDTPLREVVRTMAKKHYGCALIMEEGNLTGIFTTVDACRALHLFINKTLQGANAENIRNFRFLLVDDPL